MVAGGKNETNWSQILPNFKRTNEGVAGETAATIFNSLGAASGPTQMGKHWDET